MDQVRIAFENYDVDHSGALDLVEFRAALADLGINPAVSDFSVNRLLFCVFRSRSQNLPPLWWLALGHFGCV